ncbi:MAG: sigma-70 family RNA polymerase sigma factor [Kiritimatiellae bacterium]|nr:sigma-70 family RNA polymerase sigma factor [Kiritimatiellia bacterium]
MSGARLGEDELAEAFEANRARLMSVLARRLPPALLARLDYGDVMQDCFVAARKRLGYFASNPEVPMYFKFRTVLEQTVADLERKHLKAESRSVNRDVGIDAAEDVASGETSPLSRVDRDERHRLLRAALASLPVQDRQMIVLRHFDGYGNGECAEILGIEPKAASIRHVRALERLESRLKEVSCFRNR